MTSTQQAVAALAQLSLLVCLIGLIRSGRWRLCPSFLVYVSVVLVMEASYVWWPPLYVWSYWNLKQTVYDACKLVMAVELALRVCRDFPGAKAVTSRWVLFVLLATAGWLLLRPWEPDFLLFAAGELHARAVVGTLWLLVATGMAVRHYRLAVHPFHMGLLLGFGAYLAIWGILLRLMAVFGWRAYDFWRAIDPPAYILLVSWLVWIVWRKDGKASEDYAAVVNLLRERAV